MAVLIAAIVLLLSLDISSNAQPLSMVFTELCESNTSCTSCFNLLVYETVRSSENQYNLQRAFFPPNKEHPIYVIVKYHFKNENGEVIDTKNTWFWSRSSYYLYQPPAVLQFTSLFFAEPSSRTRRLELTLPLSCMNASIDFMQLLTQRVSIINALIAFHLIRKTTVIIQYSLQLNEIHL